MSARLPVGDGPSGLAFDGTYLWLVSHRENSLDRIDPATNAVTRVATTLSPPDTTAAERVAALGGSLWITGRGLDLLRRSPAGAPLGTVEVGPAAMDVVTDGTSLWTAAYTPAAARRGDPVAGELLRVDASGQVVARVAATAGCSSTGWPPGTARCGSTTALPGCSCGCRPEGLSVK